MLSRLHIGEMRNRSRIAAGYVDTWGWYGGQRMWAHQDSNLGPSDYESDALTN